MARACGALRESTDFIGKDRTMARDDDHIGSVLESIERQVRLTPDRIAIECGGRALDYAQVWDDSERIARVLVAAGATRGEPIGICTRRHEGMLAMLLGILRAGGAYVPLDRALPERRLGRMIERARLRRILVGPDAVLPDAVLGSGAALIDPARAAAAGTGALPVVGGDDLAYVLFTSGSTGEPKGVRILHRSLANFLSSMRHSPGLGADDVLCAVTTLSFDIAGLELYLPLTVGARIRLATEEDVIDPPRLGALLRDSGATVMQTTPTLLRMLLDAGQTPALERLRLLVGGEAMPPDLARALGSRCRELWNLYGPTETTIWSALWRVSPGDVAGAVPLGHPIDRTRIHVLDADGAPVGEGVHGEIWIGGDGVADGYLDAPDLTAERFRPDPYAADGSRMYRTGDIGSLRGGVLHFHGRADDQVKLRGYRIELGDVEAAAHEDDGVREAAAAVRRFGEHDARLVLYVAAQRNDTDLAGRLRDRLRLSLPPYMQPAHIVVLEALPHTPNGKIDRKALPDPPSSDFAAPATAAAEDPREAYMAALWREALGVAEIAATDNFFELGGDSLRAVSMLARLQAETGLRLNVLQLANGTLASLAGKLPADFRVGAPAGAGLLSRWFGRWRRGPAEAQPRRR